jgi:hypothetical protein
MVVTSYHNIPDNFISSQRWAEGKGQLLTNILSFFTRMAVMGRLSYNAGYIKKNKRGDEGNQGKRGTEKG